jgi:glutamate racemase
MVDPRPLGMLDSGVGGLSILREVRRLLPAEDIVYFADQGHVPYGPRPLEQIRTFTRGITRFFLQFDAKAVVVACNAASAASLHHLRDGFPDLPFVGMEPAVKPAARQTRSGVIGVITTKATYQGELFASVISRFASDIQVVTQVCPDFVTLVEAGQLDSPALRRIARTYLAPLQAAGIDQLVLGCTHFPFLTPVLQDILGPQVEIVDPGPAIARQTGRVIADRQSDPGHKGQVRYYTSGDPEAFRSLARRLLDEPLLDEQVRGVRWEGESVYVEEPE